MDGRLDLPARWLFGIAVVAALVSVGALVWCLT